MDGLMMIRDLAVTAAVFGVAGVAWFGWGQEDPPPRWRLLLGVGSGLGLLLAIVGGLLTWRHWGPESVFADQSVRRTFGIICGIELGLAGLGGAVLGLTKRSRWVAPWIAFVVGVHFVPLAFIFNDAGLLVLAVLVVAAAVVAVVWHRRSGVTPSAVTGLVAGASLVLFAGRAAALVLVA